MANDWSQFDAWADTDLEPFEIDGVRLEMICAACPEAYDAFLGEKRIGYLRMRGGHFYAVFPDVGGQMVYETHFSDPWQGVLMPEERKVHLPLAVKALLKRHHEAQNT